MNNSVEVESAEIVKKKDLLVFFHGKNGLLFFMEFRSMKKV